MPRAGGPPHAPRRPPPHPSRPGRTPPRRRDARRAGRRIRHRLRHRPRPLPPLAARRRRGPGPRLRRLRPPRRRRPAARPARRRGLPAQGRAPHLGRRADPRRVWPAPTRTPASRASGRCSGPSSPPGSIRRGDDGPPSPTRRRRREPHATWQVDAVEKERTADGRHASWLTVVDEATGAILAAELSPPRALAGHRARGRPASCSATPSRGGACPTGSASTAATPGASGTCPRPWSCGSTAWASRWCATRRPARGRTRGSSGARGCSSSGPSRAVRRRGRAGPPAGLGRGHAAPALPGGGGPAAGRGVPGAAPAAAAVRAGGGGGRSGTWAGRTRRVAGRWWWRRVRRSGGISLYGREVSAGRGQAGRDVLVRFDAAAVEWVHLRRDGRGAAAAPGAGAEPGADPRPARGGAGPARPGATARVIDERRVRTPTSHHRDNRASRDTSDGRCCTKTVVGGVSARLC